MSWQRVKQAFFVERHGKLKWISIGVCGNCCGVHIPAEDASRCDKSEILTYDEVKKKFGCGSEKEKDEVKNGEPYCEVRYD